MTIPPDVKACIDKHLQAVRANLSDKEESIQNEILDGLRDHLNEALARGGEPATLAKIEAIIATMDDPASYAEDPAAGAAAHPALRTSGNKWLYVAVAFLLINTIGVWKLIQIERKTGTGGTTGASQPGGGPVAVPHVPSANKSGVRYPGPDQPAAPTGNSAGDPAGNPPQPADNSLRSVAFLENKNPVVQQPNQDLTWLFSTEVVGQSEVATPPAAPPMKINPEVAGEFIWQSPTQLVFKPKGSWSLNRSYTAELVPGFKASGGQAYEGNRFWRFSTAVLDLEKIVQTPRGDAFRFDLTFTLPPTPTSLAEKLKLFYLNANGEKLPLTVKLLPDRTPGSAAVETPLVPAISFVGEIDPNLLPTNWSDGTRKKI